MGLLATLLTVLFVGLKLSGYIAWPWLWVVSPLIACVMINLLVLCGFFVVAMRK